MKKIKILVIAILFLAINNVSAAPIEQGKIIYKNIEINYGTIYITPAVIDETVRVGERIKKEIEINLSINLTREFNVTFYGRGDISNWITFEKENFIIKKGENHINFNISIPLDIGSKEYSGSIIMNNEDIDYNLVDIFLNVKNGNDSNSGNSMGVGGDDGRARTTTTPIITGPLTEVSFEYPDCRSDVDCRAGETCKYTGEYYKQCVPVSEAEETILIPTGGGLITGAAIIDTFSKNKLAGALVITLILILIVSGYFYFKKTKKEK